MSVTRHWIAPWDPPPLLRPVRHQMNNLLAPVVVAAEILDDGSETAELLTRAVDRIRGLSTRLGDLLHLTAPVAVVTPVAELLALCDLAGAVPATASVTVDPARVLCNVVTELQELEPVSLDVSVGTMDPAGAARPALVFTARFRAPFATDDADLLAVPFAVTGLDARMAMVCRETRLHGGAVAYDRTTATVEVAFPLET